MKKIAFSIVLVLQLTSCSIVSVFAQSPTVATSSRSVTPKIPTCADFNPDYLKALGGQTAAIDSMANGSCKNEIADEKELCSKNSNPQTGDPCDKAFTVEQECLKNVTKQFEDIRDIDTFVCTDLMEGIPVDVLIKDQTLCLPGAIRQSNGFATCTALLTRTGIQSITAYVGLIYTFTGWAIGILALLGVIIAGLRITIGSAVSSEVADGKKMITKIIGGVILYFLVGVILRTINPNFFL